MEFKEHILRDGLASVLGLIEHGRNTGQDKGAWMEGLIAERDRIQSALAKLEV